MNPATNQENTLLKWDTHARKRKSSALESSRKENTISKYFCEPPTLKCDHIKILCEFIGYADLMPPSKKAAMDLKVDSTGFPKLYKEPRLLQPFETWSEMLYIENPNKAGCDKLYLTDTSKLILPERYHQEAIRQAHRGVKVFQGSYTRDKDNHIRHNKFDKTLSLLKTKYAVGRNEFGIEIDSILKFVDSCPQCMLMGTDNGIGTSASTKYSDHQGYTKQPISDIAGKSGLAIRSPISMIWERPTTNTVWHNREGLAAEENLYKKMTIVIEEISMEIGLAIDGGAEATSRLLTNPELWKDDNSQFIKEMLKITDVDGFLFDLKMLTSHSRTSNAGLYWQRILAGFMCTDKDIMEKRKMAQEKVDDPPIDFNKPITLTEMDIRPLIENASSLLIEKESS